MSPWLHDKATVLGPINTPISRLFCVDLGSLLSDWHSNVHSGLYQLNSFKIININIIRRIQIQNVCPPLLHAQSQFSVA